MNESKIERHREEERVCARERERESERERERETGEAKTAEEKHDYGGGKVE